MQRYAYCLELVTTSGKKISRYSSLDDMEARLSDLAGGAGGCLVYISIYDYVKYTQYHRSGVVSLTQDGCVFNM